jgi:hypothetical protein
MTVRWTAASRTLSVGLIAVPLVLTAGVPHAAAVNGDTHITGQGLIETIDCSGGTLFVNGSDNQINALGTCWAVTMQGSSNTVVADNVINDITVYGFNQTAFFKNGEPVLIDRGRELGMTNRLDRVPA